MHRGDEAAASTEAAHSCVPRTRKRRRDSWSQPGRPAISRKRVDTFRDRGLDDVEAMSLVVVEVVGKTMVYVRAALGFALVSCATACVDEGAPAASDTSDAGESTGAASSSDDEGDDADPDCLTDDEGSCVECRPDVLDSCAPGLSCVDWACADQCEDIGGQWAGILLQEPSGANAEAGVSSRTIELELEVLDQVVGDSAGFHTCAGADYLQPPEDAVVLTGTLEGGDLTGWVAHRDDGGGEFCLELGEGHSVRFYRGELHLGCSSMSGSYVAYLETGLFSLTRVNADE